MIKNPIYNEIKANIQKEGNLTLKKVIDTNGLYLSFLMVLSYLLFIFLYNDSFGDTLSIIIISLSLALSIASLIIIKKLLDKSTAFIIMYPIFSGIFIALTSKFLKNKLMVINNEYNPNSYIFMTIGISIIGILFLSSIFYFLDIFKVRHFYYKYALLSAFEIIILLLITFFISKNIEGYSFIFNSLIAIVLILLFNFIIVLYNEEIRKLIEEPITKKQAFILSLLPLSIIHYLIIEIVFLLFKKH